MPDNDTSLILSRIEDLREDHRERIQSVHRRIDKVSDDVDRLATTTGDFRTETKSELAKLRERVNHVRETAGESASVQRRTAEAGVVSGILLGIFEAFKHLFGSRPGGH